MPRIIVVDDEEQVALALRRMLTRHGFEVATATSAAGCLALLPSFAPDVVLTDERMPGMKGAELLARVRAEAPSAVRLLISGQADLEAAQVPEGLAAALVPKPWDSDQLVALIRAALRGAP